MTFTEAVEKYQLVRLSFQSYYKYEFTYVGRTDEGERIEAGFRAEGGDIYRSHYTHEESIASAPDPVRWIKVGDIVYKE